MADDGGKEEKAGGGTSQLTKEASACVMGRQTHEQNYKGERTEQEDMENITSKRILKWLDHVFRMDKERMVNHVLDCIP